MTTKHQVAEASGQYLADAAGQVVPVGYKLTEVGVIPEDWSILSISEVALKITDGTHDTPRPVKEGFPFLTAIHVKDGRIDFENCYFLPEDVHKEIFRRCNPEFGDILMVNIGAGTATTAVVNVHYEFSLKNVALIKPNNSNNGFFINYALAFSKEKTVENISTGGAQPFLSLSQISRLKIASPKSEEQTAIANALSDVDALINELEKLIAKKQAIKTATMQQLLTGRTRLPEFRYHSKNVGWISDSASTNSTSEQTVDALSLIHPTTTTMPTDGTPKGYKPSELGEIPEDWKVVALSELGLFQSGSGFPTKYQGNQYGDYPFFKVSDMNSTGNEKYLRVANNYISEGVKSLVSAKAVPPKSIVFAKIGAAIFLERKKICSQPSCIDNNMMAFQISEKLLDCEYGYLLFLNIKLGELVEATALPSLSGKDIGMKLVRLPSLQEQTAIATILSEMDTDIQTLQQRLSKTRQIKQGMMQELLTGKTRLVRGA
jgi:type I restriction enzyme S subunit